MRSVKLFVVLLLLAGGGVMQSPAQRVATSTITNGRIVGSTYLMDVYSQGGSTTATNVRVGISNLIVNVNRDGLSPIGMTLTNVNPKFTGPPDHTGDYDPMRIDSITGAANRGKIAITIAYTGNDIGAGALLSSAVGPPAGELICTINLPILDPGLTGGITWDVANSAITDSRSQPVTNSFINDIPLPITLAYFTAQPASNGRSVQVNWGTLTEINNLGFWMEKSPGDQEHYETIPNSFVAGHGTTNEPQHYSYTDNSASSGVWYYRLKQQDMDNTVHYSEGVRVEVLTDVKELAPRVFALLQNYPNPFNPSTLIRYTLPRETSVSLKVYNALGQEVAVLAERVQKAGEYEVRLDAGNLASGTYIYRLSTDGFTSSKKLIVLR